MNTDNRKGRRQVSPRQQRKRRVLAIALKLRLPALRRRMLLLLAVTGGDRAVNSLAREFGVNFQAAREAVAGLERHRLVTTAFHRIDGRPREFVQCVPLEEIEHRLQEEARREQEEATQPRCEACDTPMAGRRRFCTACLPLDPAAVHELPPPNDSEERAAQTDLRVRLECERYAQGLPLHPQLLSEDDRRRHAAGNVSAEDRGELPKKGNLTDDD